MMVKNLLQGRGEFVRHLQAVGFRFDNMLDEVSSGTSQYLSDHEVVRHSVWKWSSKSSSAAGIHAWWDQINKILLTTPEDQRSRILCGLFTEAAEVVSFSGSHTFEPFARTWDASLKWFDKAPGWDEKTRNHLVFSAFLGAGDYAAPAFNQLWSTGRLGASNLKSKAFLNLCDELKKNSIQHSFPVLLESLIENVPNLSNEDLTLSKIPACQWIWIQWLNEHNRPEALSMESETFQSMTGVLEVLLRHTKVWPDGLQSDLKAHLPILQKNPQWTSLVSVVEREVLSHSLSSGNQKSSSRRL